MPQVSGITPRAGLERGKAFILPFAPYFPPKTRCPSKKAQGIEVRVDGRPTLTATVPNWSWAAEVSGTRCLVNPLFLWELGGS